MAAHKGMLCRAITGNMEKYELVAGFETHVELATDTKIFCGCTTKFGGEPNTHTCPVCTGMPGALPRINRKAVEYTIMAGLATNGKINNLSKMDRKNYFYPDLPKAYQVSQFERPLSIGGYIELDSGKRIRINHIHLEEDAGKLVHKGGKTYIDYNRGGVPLMEIVSEPDIRSIEEGIEYLEKLQMIMRYIGVSDCKMQEGSMRCDVNISVRPAGSEEFGIRSEIKNMNSFAHIAKAMEYEYNRKVDAAENGEILPQETRRYNETTGETEGMRTKEDAHDYRYFLEPDLVPMKISDEEIENIKNTLPQLPAERIKRYISEYGLSDVDAKNIAKYKNVADFFEGAAELVKNPKTVSNMIITQIFSSLGTEEEKEACRLKITPKQLSELINLLDAGEINSSTAKKALSKMLETGKSAEEVIPKDQMGGLSDKELNKLVQEAVSQCQPAVNDYLAGKEKAIKAVVGYVMKQSRGKADAAKAEQMIIEMVKK